jgi:hypothetical protein
MYAAETNANVFVRAVHSRHRGHLKYFSRLVEDELETLKVKVLGHTNDIPCVTFSVRCSTRLKPKLIYIIFKN